MHRIGREPSGDRIGADDLGCNGEHNAVLGETPHGVLGRPQPADAAGRIAQRGAHRVPAVEQGGAIAAGALRPYMRGMVAHPEGACELS
jgi:hypothetical protein